MKPVALLVAAHPIWNVPPFVNAARELARHGYNVIVLGYQGENLPRYERIGQGAWILRLQLRSRQLRWAGLRKALALVEFLQLARSTVVRLRPNVLITFNDPACILQRISPGKRRRVNWLLEYPELERLDFASRRLFHFSASCWKDADTIVAPTRERLALHLALRPDCSVQQTFVIQNAPCQDAATPEATCERTESALGFLASGPPRALRIIYSGAIGNRYAIDSLIRAVGAFPNDTRLLLLGPKHPLAEAEVDAALLEANSPANIEWIDEIPYRELASVLAAADVGFGTYLGDTLNTRFSAPGKLYEYLKNGLIILSDDDCCLSAEATAAGCGVFFPRPASATRIQGAIRSLLNRRDEVEAMKQASRRLFEERLCMEKQIAPLIADLSRSAPERDRVIISTGYSGNTFPLPSR